MLMDYSINGVSPTDFANSNNFRTLRNFTKHTDKTTTITMKRENGYFLNSEFKPELVQFRFTSVGRKGEIEKIIISIFEC